MKTSDPCFTKRPDAALDRLLADAASELPDDFVGRVMAQLPPRALQALPAPPPRRLRTTLLRGLRVLALLAGSLLGLSQVLAFVLGVWLASAAA